MVADVFTYNGEADMLELRLNILDPYVDLFFIGEAELTFSGYAKPLYFLQQKQRFAKFAHKIRYVPIQNYYFDSILKSMAMQYEIKSTSYPFLMAFYQKEHLLKGLTLEDTDTVYYGDVDEIWTPQEVQPQPAKLEQLCYSMFLDYRSTEPWKGTLIATYAQVKQYGLNQLRHSAPLTLKNGGWHFTNMGGLEELRRKIKSYDHQEVNTPEIHSKLEERFIKAQDFLGRNIQLYQDTSDWPQYLKFNKEKYQHLCK